VSLSAVRRSSQMKYPPLAVRSRSKATEPNGRVAAMASKAAAVMARRIIC